MKKDNFIFDPKKWLGDIAIINMDWDVRGMHIQLMCYAAQQKLKGFLVYDEGMIVKILNITFDDWNNRIKNQIMSAWKKVTIEDENGAIDFIKLDGLISTFEEQSKSKKTKPRKINQESTQNNGSKEQATPEERQTIWSVGISKLTEQNISEQNARSFLAKLIKQYGEKNVANCIAQLSINKYIPAQIQSYMVGVLAKEPKKSTRGSVSL